MASYPLKMNCRMAELFQAQEESQKRLLNTKIINSKLLALIWNNSFQKEFIMPDSRKAFYRLFHHPYKDKPEAGKESGEEVFIYKNSGDIESKIYPQYEITFKDILYILGNYSPIDDHYVRISYHGFIIWVFANGEIYNVNINEKNIKRFVKNGDVNDFIERIFINGLHLLGEIRNLANPVENIRREFSVS